MSLDGYKRWSVDDQASQQSDRNSPANVAGSVRPAGLAFAAARPPARGVLALSPGGRPAGCKLVYRALLSGQGIDID
ncbi:hypothetical protein EG328_006212 [Venturia inaequalis]|uniref:Uncharacterized protein n=1 Tax=Venturia inaequalis TaxID=5025 RepID=A0A8H3UHU1_VENIN|nr:hypothetical protein EG328_006212 [Venturia inaequalis]